MDIQARAGYEEEEEWLYMTEPQRRKDWSHLGILSCMSNDIAVGS